jgi:predicted Zn-dependent peptidase
MVVAVGDLDASAFLDLLDSTLARIPDGHVSEAHGINTPRPFLLNESRKGLQQTSLVMAFPACAHRHPDRVAANLLAYVLGGGMSSRLFMELREKRALCYQVSSFLTHYEDTGALQISASCSSKRARELVKCALAECVRLASDGVRRDELEQTKLHARTSLVFSQESTAARMFSLAHQAMHMDEIRDLDGLLAEMEAVDLDHLNRVARDILVPERIGLSALGVRKDAEIRPCELES